MSILFDNPPPAIGCGDPGDPIEFGCLFDGAQYLHRTPTQTGNRRLMCAVFWAKRTSAEGAGNLFGRTEIAGTDSDYLFVPFLGGGGVRVDLHTGLVYEGRHDTVAKYSDPASRSQFHIIIDTENPLGSEGIRITKDGVRQAVSIPYPVALNADVWANVAGIPFHIGANVHSTGADSYLKAILSDFIWFDGFAPDVSEFGYFNSDGVWVHKEFAGKGQGASVYGVNGFHLDFADPLDLGKDVSGNGNHFTAVGLTSDHQVKDTPSQNKSTWNPVHKWYSGGSTPGWPAGTFSEGNRRFNSGATSYSQANGSMLLASSSYYGELQVDYAAGSISFGVVNQSGEFASWNMTLGYINGGLYVGTVSNGDRVGSYVDMDLRKVWFHRLGTWINGDPGTKSGGLDIPGSSPVILVLADGNGSSGEWVDATLITDDFAYPELQGEARKLSPSEYPCPDILNPDDYFTTRQSIGGGDITDLPWDPTVHKTLCLSKRRDSETDWRASDTVRGDNLAWSSNVGGLETACSLSFTPSGIAPGADTEYQGSRIDYFWRASPKSGFDIVEFTHVNGTPTTVSHAAGGVIEFALVVPLDGGDIRIYHHEKPDDYAILNSTGYGTDAGWLGTTAVNITLAATRPSGRYIAYVWRGVPQFSNFSAYPGNGLADGSFAPTDFLPRCIFLRRATSGVSSRTVLDDLDRYEGNPSGSSLYMDGVEIEGTGSNPVDLVSNGAKLRVAGTVVNQIDIDHLFGAWAKTPGKFARAR